MGREIPLDEVEQPEGLGQENEEIDGEEEVEDDDEDGYDWEGEEEEPWQDPSDNGILGQILMAAEDGDSEKIVMLLGELSVGLDTLGPEGDTPLHLAALYGHENVVEALLRAGATPNACDGNGGTPLHDASAGGFINIVRRLLQACPSLLNDVDADGDTPLHCAARGGHLDVCSELLAMGADRTAANFADQKALDLVELRDRPLRELFGENDLD